MKTAIYIISIVLVFTIGLSTFFIHALVDQGTTLLTQNTLLNNTISNLTDNITQLSKTANLKSFENLKALKNFLANAQAPKEDSTYASQSCIDLMKEAKEQGYWLGITAINSTDESVYKAIAHNLDPDVQWHSFNIAIVGDQDIYLIDSQDASWCYFLVTIQGDFAQYNETNPPTVDLLKLH